MGSPKLRFARRVRTHWPSITGKDRLRGDTRPRSHWMLAALVLFLCSAAPVLADDSSEQAASGVPAESPVSGGPLANIGPPPNGPSSEQVIEALQGAEREEEEREAILASPAAVKEREDSLQAYADLTPAQAEALLTAK